MKKVLKIFVATLLFCVLSLGFVACGGDDDGKEAVPPTEKAPEFLVTDGAKIINSVTKEEFSPKGINAGGWLVREGWMCPMQLDATHGGDSYYDRGMVEILEQRFGREQADNLQNAYLDNWWTVADFDNVKAAGFNHIRLNFSYMNFYYVTDMTRRADAFLRMDWFVEECAKRGLYVILDMHGAFGSQNGRHHSGDTTQATLFTSEENMQKTQDLWVEIATHYKNNPYVFAYDLLNEPEGDFQTGNTDKREWDYFDRLYKAIRQVDENHIIMMEGCWEINTLPNPDNYFWENVVYQIHVYDWANDSNFWLWKELCQKSVQSYNVPVYVGEWNAFSKPSDWEDAFNFYEKHNIGWCVWTYKTTGGGNWSLYGGNSAGTVDLSVDSYDTIMQKWTATKTDTDGRYTKNTELLNILSPHL